MKKYEQMRAERTKKNKKADVPIVQPVVVHNHPQAHWKFWQNYHEMVMFTQQWLSREIEEKSLTQPPFILLSLKRFYHVDVGYSRSFLAEFSILNKATKTLYLDSDNTFEPDTIVRLMSHDKRVVSGLYFTHGRTSDMYPMSVRPVMYKYDYSAKGGYKQGGHYKYKSIINWNTEEDLVEVDGCGGGCLLVDNSIFIELRKHLKEYKGIMDSDITGVKGIHMYFECTPYHTEDFVFINNVKEKLNEKVYVDPSVMCGHLQDKNVKGKDFLVSKQIEVSKIVGSDKIREMSAKEIIEFDLSKENKKWISMK